LEKRVQPIIKKARQQKQTPEVVAPGLEDEHIWRLFERYIAKKQKAAAEANPNPTKLLGAKVDWAYFAAPVIESYSAWTFWFDGHSIPLSSVSRFRTFAGSDEFNRSVLCFFRASFSLIFYCVCICCIVVI
jgi:hypothetical protein